MKRLGMAYYELLQFMAHLAWGISFGIAGYCFHWSFFIIWALVSFYFELINDGHWKAFIGKDPEWKDFLWDIGSRMFGVIIGAVCYLLLK